MTSPYFDLVEFYKAPAAPWQVFDLSSAPGGSSIYGTFPLALLQQGSNVHLFALRPDSHLLDFYKAPDPAPWQVFDLSSATGSKEIVSISSSAATLVGNDIHVYVTDGFSHLIEFYRASSSSTWQSFNLTQAVGITGIAFGAAVSVLVTNNEIHVYTISADQHVLEFYKPSNPVPWQVFDLSAAVGSPPQIVRDLTTLLNKGVIYVYAASVGGHLLEFSKALNATSWQIVDVTAATGGIPQLVGGIPTAMAFQSNYVYAWDLDRHLLEFHKVDPAPWKVTDLTAATGGTQVMGIAPTRIREKWRNSLCAWDADYHLLEFFMGRVYEPQEGFQWQVANLTTATSTWIVSPPAVLSTGTDVHIYAAKLKLLSPHNLTANGFTSVVLPTNLTNCVSLNWEYDLPMLPGGTHAITFKIERKTGASGVYNQIAVVQTTPHLPLPLIFDDDCTSLQGGNLQPGHTYFYRVKASTPLGDSAYSNEVNVTIPSSSPPPPPPPVQQANLGVVNAYYSDEANTIGITLHQGDAFIVHFVVQNAGTKATGAFQVYIRLDPNEQATILIDVASLQPGVTTDVTWDFPNGLTLQDSNNSLESFEFTATLDPSGVVPEAPGIRTSLVGVIIYQ